MSARLPKQVEKAWSVVRLARLAEDEALRAEWQAWLAEEGARLALEENTQAKEEAMLAADLRWVSENEMMERLHMQEGILWCTSWLLKSSDFVRRTRDDSEAVLANAAWRKKQATGKIDVIRNALRQRDRSRQQRTEPPELGNQADGPGATGCGGITCVHAASYVAREALDGRGCRKGLSLKMEGFDACACTRMTLAQIREEEEEEDVRKKEREARDAAEHVAAKLRRLEEENAELREGLAYVRRDALNRRNRFLNQIGELESERNTLGKDLEAEREKSMCNVCYVEPRNTVVLPCFHFMFCKSCMKRAGGQGIPCPTCRVPITGSMAVLVP